MIKKILSILVLAMMISCNPEGKEQKIAGLDSLYAAFKSGIALDSFSQLSEGRHIIKLSDESSYIVEDETIALVPGIDWPEVTLSEDKEWLVNGSKTGKKLSDKASCIVASHLGMRGLWLRLDNSEIIYYQYTGSKNFACFRAEKALNPELKKDYQANISGNEANFNGMDLPPVPLKVTIAVWGHSLMQGDKPYINGLSIINPRGESLSYTDFNGNQRTIVYKSDLRMRVPIIEIETENRLPITSRETYIRAKFTVRDDYNFYGSSSACELEGQIRGRGNSTWDMPKKPYRLKFDDKAKLMGMPSSKHWALLANYSDKTLLRNSAAMRISEACNVLSWTPRHRNAEVYLNGTYLGLYSVFETVRPAKDRVPIDISGVDEGTDITGGYFLEVDEKESNPARWWTAKSVPMSFKDPEEPSAEQISYVKEYISKVEKALYDYPANDLVNGYKAYIDVDSFAANYIVQELTKNVDGNFRLSTFLAKYKGDDKLYVSNVWDFDLALGNCDYVPGGNGPTGLIIRNSPWYIKLCDDPEFRKAVKTIWATVYSKIDTIIADLQNEADDMRVAIDKNFQTWKILNTYVWPNYFAKGTYDEHLDFMLKYLRERADWMDTTLATW